MSTITIDQVKELRDQTGVSIMQCRKALEEAGGDMEKATIILKKKSGDIAAKNQTAVRKTASLHSNKQLTKLWRLS